MKCHQYFRNLPCLPPIIKKKSHCCKTFSNTILVNNGINVII